MAKHAVVIDKFAHLEELVAHASSRHVLFGTAEFKKLLFDVLDRNFAAGAIVLSLDIFDTLLLRDSSSELTRFIEIGKLMASIIDGQHPEQVNRHVGGIPTKRQLDAFLARHLGTKASYRAGERVDGVGEGSLLEIHKVASHLLAGNADYADAFVETEIDFEATKVTVNTMLLDYVTLHRQRGGRVVLATDMYMHATHVTALLLRLGVSLELFDLIISSADTKHSKASGGIFPIIETRLGLPGSSFMHIGDSFNGDFKRPKQRGWEALHLPIADAEVKDRRADHLASTAMLQREFSLQVDIASP